MIVYNKHGLRMAELWLDEEVKPPADVDVLLLQQYTRLPAGARGSDFHSLVVDLTLPEEALLGGIDGTVRYDLRRADTKDATVCQVEPVATQKLVEAFRNFYAGFAAEKALPRLPEAELAGRAGSGQLVLSRAVWQGRTVVWHAHVEANDTAALLHSASHFRATDAKDERAAIGRANKLLHWKDMLHFRRQGMRRYDFGGWYAGDADQALLSINAFKERFGGQRVQQVNGAMAASWRGVLYVALRQAFSARQRKLLSNAVRKFVGT